MATTVGLIAGNKGEDMEQEWELDDPVIDEETGARNYTVRYHGEIVSFAVIPEESDDGIPRWVMQLGANRIMPANPNFEPFETAEEAYRAGLRAARESFQR